MSQEQQEQQVAEVVAEVIHEEQQEQQVSGKRKRDEDEDEEEEQPEQPETKQQKQPVVTVECAMKLFDAVREYKKAENVIREKYRKLEVFTTAFQTMIEELQYDLSEEAIVCDLHSHFPKTANRLTQPPLPQTVEKRLFFALHEQLCKMQLELVKVFSCPEPEVFVSKFFPEHCKK